MSEKNEEDRFRKKVILPKNWRDMIIPLLRCANIQRSVNFYSGVLGFQHIGTWPLDGDPAFSILVHNGYELHLSSHTGDGILGNCISIIVSNLDELYLKLLARDYKNTRLDSPVHLQPILQTWGTKEWYVVDPDGNSIRWIERLHPVSNS